MFTPSFLIIVYKSATVYSVSVELLDMCVSSAYRPNVRRLSAVLWSHTDNQVLSGLVILMLFLANLSLENI